MYNLENSAPINYNSPLLPSSQYVNIPATNGTPLTNVSNAFVRHGCGGISQSGGKSKTKCKRGSRNRGGGGKEDEIKKAQLALNEAKKNEKALLPSATQEDKDSAENNVEDAKQNLTQLLLDTSNDNAERTAQVDTAPSYSSLGLPPTNKEMKTLREKVRVLAGTTALGDSARRKEWGEAQKKLNELERLPTKEVLIMEKQYMDDCKQRLDANDYWTTKESCERRRDSYNEQLKRIRDARCRAMGLPDSCSPQDAHATAPAVAAAPITAAPITTAASPAVVAAPITAAPIAAPTAIITKCNIKPIQVTCGGNITSKKGGKKRRHKKKSSKKKRKKSKRKTIRKKHPKRKTIKKIKT